MTSTTLSLFKDLTAGYMSGKLLSKLNASTFLLASHNPQSYSFLRHIGNAHNRTMFYATLARMIFVEDSPSKFKAFVAPLQQVCWCNGTWTYTLLSCQTTPHASLQANIAWLRLRMQVTGS